MIGHVLEPRPEADLARVPVDGRRTVLGKSTSARGAPNRRGRAQHGTDIVRIADLVEQHDDLADGARPAGGRADAVDDVLDGELGQRLDRPAPMP